MPYHPQPLLSCLHAPVFGSQVSSVQESLSVQIFAVPWHLPDLHVEFVRHLLPSPQGIVSLALVACGKSDPPCAEPTPAALDQQTVAAREKLAYVTSAPTPEKACDRCSYFKAGRGCGTCTVVPEPIAPKGTCKLFKSA